MNTGAYTHVSDFLPLCGKVLARELLNADEETVAEEALSLAYSLVEVANTRIEELVR